MKGSASAGGAKKAAGPLIKDDKATMQNNLNVLKRTDPDVEEVLGTAGHVCLYGFDVDTKQWARARGRARASAAQTLSRVAALAGCADAPRSRTAWLQSRKEVEGSMFVVKRCGFPRHRATRTHRPLAC